MSDLEAREVARALGNRPVQAYPALLSTEAAAMAWARSGAASGAVVVADYQASPRGRGGLPWTAEAGHGLGFSLILRPALSPEREGWPYVAASVAVLECLGEQDVLEWPDTLLAKDGHPVASLGVYVELGADQAEWVTVTVLLPDAAPPRGPLLEELVVALEQRVMDSGVSALLTYRSRCVTLGRSVRARMIPMGPGGPEVNGEAVDVLADGSLVVLTEQGHRVAVQPQNLGLLEPPESPAELPVEILRRLRCHSDPGH